MFMYPDNLKGKPTLWLWYLRDIGIIGIGAIFSVIAISQLNFYIPVAIVGAYGFLTIRSNDISIYDFLRYACAFFIYKQQIYYWRYTHSLTVADVNDRNYKKRKIWR